MISNHLFTGEMKSVLNFETDILYHWPAQMCYQYSYMSSDGSVGNENTCQEKVFAVEWEQNSGFQTVWIMKIHEKLISYIDRLDLEVFVNGNVFHEKWFWIFAQVYGYCYSVLDKI